MYGGNDPFGNMFGHMRQQMNMMDQMMGSMMDPFGMMGGPPRRPAPFGMLEDARMRGPPVQRQLAHPFDPFGMGMGGGIGGMFNAMNHLSHHAMNDPDSHVYSQSTVMTFGPDGVPRVVESSTRKAGDVKETRRTVRDGARQEMEIGHSIGDRTHVIEKKRDKDGKMRSQQKFVNLDESEVHDFDHEFKSRARRNIYGGGESRNTDTARNALEFVSGVRERLDRRHSDRYGSSSRYNNDLRTPSSRVSAPIITLPDEEEDEDMPEVIESSGPSSRYGGGGPIIREISEEEAESSVSKKRRDNQGGSRPGSQH